MKLGTCLFLGLFLLLGCEVSSPTVGAGGRVASCSECPDTTVCAAYIVMFDGPINYCKSIPDACIDDVSCDCLGEDVCEGSYDACDDVEEGVTCSCIDC